MKTILFISICIIALLWVGDLTITFKPFSISLPGWYKPIGIILFCLSVAVYNIGEYTRGYKQGFDDGIKNVLKYLKKMNKEEFQTKKNDIDSKIRKMSKSEEYIEIKSFVVVNPNFPVITKESALKAVAMAEEEMKRKAIEVLSSVLDNWVHGGDADCIIAEFEERLNIG